MLYRAATIVLPLVLLFISPASRAQDQIHRCIGDDGLVSFTDRPCDDLQMQETGASRGVGTGTVGTAPSTLGPVGKLPMAVLSCARNREDLLSDVREALALHDVNRFASTYLWTGMRTREAYARMNRFSLISARPLVDAQLVSTQIVDAPMYDVQMDYAQMIDTHEFDGQVVDPPPTDAPADQIRIDQLHSSANPEAETSYFNIVTAAGCVWIRD